SGVPNKKKKRGAPAFASVKKTLTMMQFPPRGFRYRNDCGTDFSPSGRAEARPTWRLTPDRGLLRPDRVLVSIFECLCGGFERAGIVGRFVAGNARPVHRLSGSLGARQFLDHIAELPLGIGEILPIELRVTQTELELTQEFGRREEA